MIRRRRQPRDLDWLLETLKIHIYEGFMITMAAIDDLTAAVAADTTVDASAVTLLNQLKSLLDAAIASNDPTALQALSDQLGSNSALLAAAVTANTPAAPAT